MNKLILFLSLIIIQFSCIKKSDTVKPESHSEPTYSGNCIADTITYDVIIKKTSMLEDWEIAWLKGLSRKEYLDKLFDDIYSDKIKTYEFFFGDEISADRIEKMEKKGEIIRDDIGKIQFSEAWYYDNLNQAFSKKVLKMTFGQEIKNDVGNVTGYKSLFTIYNN